MNITEIIISVIALLVALAEAFLIPWIKTKIKAERLAELIEFVKLGVQAAEQLIGEKKGAEKKEFVINYLKSKGLTFDEQTVEAAIEAAVLEMNNSLLK